jgi:hypothetical protein
VTAKIDNVVYPDNRRAHDRSVPDKERFMRQSAGTPLIDLLDAKNSLNCSGAAG